MTSVRPYSCISRKKRSNVTIIQKFTPTCLSLIKPAPNCKMWPSTQGKETSFAEYLVSNYLLKLARTWQNVLQLFTPIFSTPASNYQKAIITGVRERADPTDMPIKRNAWDGGETSIVDSNDLSFPTDRTGLLSLL